MGGLGVVGFLRLSLLGLSRGVIFRSAGFH